MKPNELMIDDLVLDKKTNRPYKITGTNDLLFHNDYSPISLTPEILEKNGFIGGEYKSYTGYVWYLEEKGFSKIWFIMSCEKSILWGEKIKPNDSFSIPNIKFVHELQHALRLCNIEKEIEL